MKAARQGKKNCLAPIQIILLKLQSFSGQQRATLQKSFQEKQTSFDLWAQ